MAAINRVSNLPKGERLRVLHISEAYGGGIASAINDCALRTPEFDHVLLVAHRRGKVGIGEQLPGLAVHELRTSLPAAIVDIRRVVRDDHVDVVHAHSSYAGLYARLALSPKRVPIVYSPHCFGFERTDVRAPVKAALLGIERLLARRTSAFVVVGQRERQAAARVDHQIPTLRVPHVPPAPSSRHRQTGTAFRVGVVGRLCAQKDPRFFRDLVLEVRARHPRVAIDWQWLGDGEQEMVIDLRSEGVVVTGWTTREAAITSMEHLDLCLLTSAWEGFPFTVIEAATRRIPVLARAIPALVEEGFPNLAIGPSAMADIVADAATSQVRYDRLERATREWLDRYTEESEAVDLSSLYITLASDDRRDQRRHLQLVHPHGTDAYTG